MKNYLKKNILIVTGVLIGGIAGLSYWHFVGCSTGTCPITSHPVNSTLYGMFMGGLLFSLFKKEEKAKSDK